MSCKICGSFAVNEHLYDRERGTDADLCDVHYWMKRAEATKAAQVQAHQQKTEGKRVCMREKFEKVFPVPEDVLRDSVQGYISNDAYNPTACIAANLQKARLQAWQAATALQAERVRELERLLNDSCCHSHGEAFSEHCGWCVDTRKALSATAREGTL